VSLKSATFLVISFMSCDAGWPHVREIIEVNICVYQTTGIILRIYISRGMHQVVMKCFVVKTQIHEFVIPTVAKATSESD
jgi:hypothetical protein